MKWFNIIKGRFAHRDEFNTDVTDFNLPEARHSSLPPDIKWTNKIRVDTQRKKELKPISVSGENNCPPGTLWCEQHEECEDEKDWKTHNRVLTAEEIKNQKQFQTSGKLNDR